MWVLGKEPSFFKILDDAHNLCNDDDGDITCDDSVSKRAFYSSAVYIMIIIVILVIPFAFFGCCGYGAMIMKESKMIGTYVVMVTNYAKKFQKNRLFPRALLHFFYIVILAGAIHHPPSPDSGKFEEQIKTPFEKALKKYNDEPAEDNQSAINYKSVWNEVQAEVKIIDGQTDLHRYYWKSHR